MHRSMTLPGYLRPQANLADVPIEYPWTRIIVDSFHEPGADAHRRLLRLTRETKSVPASASTTSLSSCRRTIAKTTTLTKTSARGSTVGLSRDGRKSHSDQNLIP